MLVTESGDAFQNIHLTDNISLEREISHSFTLLLIFVELEYTNSDEYV